MCRHREGNLNNIDTMIESTLFSVEFCTALLYMLKVNKMKNMYQMAPAEYTVLKKW